MNKLLKVTLITAIMATSGMCMSGECQRTTFEAGDNIDYNLGHTASHGSTWITETTSGNSNTDIKGDVKITDGSRWIHNKGWIRLKGEGNIIDNSEVINNGWVSETKIEVYDTGKLNIKDRSSILVKGYASIGACGNGAITVDKSTISMKDIASIGANNNSTINVDKSTISMKDIAGIGANNNSTINVNKSTICMKDSARIGANNSCTINVDNSSISLSDDAYIGAYEKGTININEGSIIDARDSKDLSNWNTLSGTFNMEAGSIMYLPSTDIGAGKKANMFFITLPSEDKPVELRYIQHTDITFDGLCPRVTPIGYKYKLSDWEKGTDTDTGITYIQEPNTGIVFTGTTDKVRLTPIYTWSVSTICDGRKIQLLESSDFQCCEDIL